jgi:hypothetical protein
MLKIPPQSGRFGTVHWSESTGPGKPDEGTEVEVLGPGNTDERVRVRLVATGQEIELKAVNVDCGQLIFYRGRWIPWTDILRENQAALG